MSRSATRSPALDSVMGEVLATQPLANGSIKGTMVRGTSIKPHTKPRAYEEPRLCQNPDCGKRLSMYNRGPFCYSHESIRYPRIRGRKE